MENYLNYKKLPCLITGKYTADGVVVTSSLTIPLSKVRIPQFLKKKEFETEKAAEHAHKIKPACSPEYGDSILMLRDLGGQNYLVVDVFKEEKG